MFLLFCMSALSSQIYKPPPALERQKDPPSLFPPTPSCCPTHESVFFCTSNGPRPLSPLPNSREKNSPPLIFPSPVTCDCSLFPRPTLPSRKTGFSSSGNEIPLPYRGYCLFLQFEGVVLLPLLFPTLLMETFIPYLAQLHQGSHSVAIIPFPSSSDRYFASLASPLTPSGRRPSCPSASNSPLL